MKRILILSANPKDTSPLRLDEEIREIEEGLKRSHHRDQFELTAKGAVRLHDFYRHMLEVQPQIVHFCGHGHGEQGLVLEDEVGHYQFLQTEQLAAMFKLFAAKGLECVLLNACYSEAQATAINQSIPYVIGMNQAIGDKAAIKFAVAFYDTLGAGESVTFAFDLAKIQLMGLQEDLKPVLLTNTEAIAKLNKSDSESDRKITPQKIPTETKPETDRKNTVTIEMKTGDHGKQIAYIERVENMTF